jgi:hypothetical protein
MSRFGLLVALLASHFCSAQVTGTFSLEKTAFAPGEPVFLSFTLHNEGKEAEEINTADPYSFCSGYQLHITRDGTPEPKCFRGYGGSCLSGATPLKPGASHTERILLNFENDSRGDLGTPIRTPGDYTVDATRDIAFAPPGPDSRVYTAPNHSQIHQVLHFRVDDVLRLSPSAYDPYVQQLQSNDSQVRHEAARTLAALAPPALEPLLLTFPTSKDLYLRQFAPLALANLSTKASLSALAQILLHTEPGTYEFMVAVQKLGQTHDPAWFPLLLEVADQHSALSLLHNAAESGGDAAISTLLGRLPTTDVTKRSEAIYALGYTGSRAAVPILIQLLDPYSNQNAQDGQSDTIPANIALQQLTHVYAEPGPNGSLIPTWRNRWQQWWVKSGASATIYKPTDCGASTKLP